VQERRHHRSEHLRLPWRRNVRGRRDDQSGAVTGLESSPTPPRPIAPWREPAPDFVWVDSPRRVWSGLLSRVSPSLMFRQLPVGSESRSVGGHQQLEQLAACAGRSPRQRPPRAGGSRPPRWPDWRRCRPMGSSVWCSMFHFPTTSPITSIRATHCTTARRATFASSKARSVLPIVRFVRVAARPKPAAWQGVSRPHPSES